MTGNSNGVSTYTTAINNNFAAIKAELANLGGGASYSATCPAITPVDGVATWTITHNLGSQAVVTALYSNNNKIEHNTLITSNNALTVTFKASSTVSAGSYKIVVLASGGNSGGGSGADVDLSNISDTAKITIAHNAMPSSTYEDLTLGATGTTYTAPADGYFYLQVIENSGAWLNFNIDSTGFDGTYTITMHNSGGHGYNQATIVPVAKNRDVTITYDGISRIDYFRFIYAVGSESEAS